MSDAGGRDTSTSSGYRREVHVSVPHPPNVYYKQVLDEDVGFDCPYGSSLRGPLEGERGTLICVLRDYRHEETHRS